jgi:hypothetical protein
MTVEHAVNVLDHALPDLLTEITHWRQEVKLLKIRSEQLENVMFFINVILLVSTYTENHINLLRQRTIAWLVENDLELFGDKPNPFGNKFIPLMGEFPEGEPSNKIEAYESGNRSILFKHDGVWYKAKGIGIPVGVSRPIFMGGKIYTYQLFDDPGMCHKFILWGFMKENEYRCELFGSKRAKELGQEIEIIGTSSFNNVHYLSVKDRIELFNKLKNTKRNELMELFNKSDVTSAYSAYYVVPTDIRVGELFFALVFPEVTRLIDPDRIRDYVKWLGSSCGYLLREFHDSGALHGTWVGPKPTSLGLKDVHSNSYTGNYLVSEDHLTMCDFDLSKAIDGDSEKKTERWALIHMENPLHYAGSYSPKDALIQGIARKNPFREELAKVFEKSVDSGYNKEQWNLERKETREMLDVFVRAKRVLWDLYSLPKSLVGQIDYVDHIVATRRVDSNRFKELRAEFESCS